MKMRLVSFGEIEIEGRHYEHDVVIDAGEVRKRSKKPSKTHRNQFGHTPLSARENIPWHGDKLFIGTGNYGRLPVMQDVFTIAQSKGIEIIARPTAEVCELLKEYRPRDVNAILHVTC